MSVLQHKVLRLPGQGFAKTVLLLSRILHGMAVGMPAALLLYLAGQGGHYVFYTGFSLALIASLVFQVLGIYTDGFFTNKYRFKKTLLSWSIAFLVLIIMMQGFGLEPELGGLRYVVWFFWVYGFNG